MLNHKLLRCRSCALKWFPRGEAAGACPACGGKDVGGTFELFHLGIVLVVLAGIAWAMPAMGLSTGGDRPIAAALSSVVETRQPPANAQRTRPADAQRTPPADAQRAHLADSQRAHPAAAAAPLSAVIKAKKLTVHVQRGPAKGHMVTLRRGDKITILARNQRRLLVKDRRGNQFFVPLDKLTLQKAAETRRQYVQR